jgi:hypothetical protein
MKIAGKFSFNNGESYIEKHFEDLLKEVENVIKLVDIGSCKTKSSKEKTMYGKMLYSPSSLNKLFKTHFDNLSGWKNHKERCEYPSEYYVNDYKFQQTKNAYRDMDFVKNKLGVEVQFGKYSFMVYNVCAKMTIFKNLGIIQAGIEIVPVKELAKEMSTGVSYFEQFVWDLKARGIADIDIPVLIIGINK